MVLLLCTHDCETSLCSWGKSEAFERYRSCARMTVKEDVKVREVRARRLNGIALVHTRL